MDGSFCWPKSNSVVDGSFCWPKSNSVVDGSFCCPKSGGQNPWALLFNQDGYKPVRWYLAPHLCDGAPHIQSD